MGFVIISNFLKNPQPGNDMAFHRIYSFYGNLYIHKHWEFLGFSLTLNLPGSEDYGISLCFVLLFPYYLNSLLFPILFSYYGNSIFPCSGNCMDFCFMRNI